MLLYDILSRGEKVSIGSRVMHSMKDGCDLYSLYIKNKGYNEESVITFPLINIDISDTEIAAWSSVLTLLDVQAKNNGGKTFADVCNEKSSKFMALYEQGLFYIDTYGGVWLDGRTASMVHIKKAAELLGYKLVVQSSTNFEISKIG